MELATVIVIVAAVLVALWALGSTLLRLAAWVLWISAAVGLAIEDGTGLGPALLAILGLLLWLGGHWLFAYKHGFYRSPLAQRILTRALPRRLDPTHGLAGGVGDAAGRGPTP